MVVFTCNNCGETLQKPKVAKHYEFQCRSAPFLTCVDCFKDFRGEEYVVHTKCKSEAERYGGKDYVPKANANKGEKKQKVWIDVVNNLLNSGTNLSIAERNFLNILSKYDNIPRKKIKFLNFVKNAVGNKVNGQVINNVWDKMETAFKNNVQNTNTQNEKQQENGKGNEKLNNADNVNTHQENNVVENQNNENIYRENRNEDRLNKSNVNEATQDGIEATQDQILKKKNKDVTNVLMKKNENTSFSETSVNQCDNITKKSTFSWKRTILDIVKSKGEISLKKLQKKVISQYMNSCSNTVLQEKASSKFNKKLKKISEITISDEKVTLA
ncbi:Cell growth-regulating nucleolar protein [Melipona quadrifasciata]|uniref:Cell growth-regulating nucleolar protein n=1 Tax=Melipona quadrifasciata TaxID=166423 RepID=A0A0N0BL21_9HYME|nr:Cell growth-regulating nucleolar protein [Melipona quadrifasciata]